MGVVPICTELGYWFWHDENSCSDALLTASGSLSGACFFQRSIGNSKAWPLPTNLAAPRKPRASQAQDHTASADTPLDYMLKVMRDDEADAKRRDEMAKIAASYVHLKPSERQGSGAKAGQSFTIDLTKATDEQLATLESFFGPLAGPGGDDGSDTRGEDETEGLRRSARNSLGRLPRMPREFGRAVSRLPASSARPGT